MNKTRWIVLIAVVVLLVAAVLVFFVIPGLSGKGTNTGSGTTNGQPANGGKVIQSNPVETYVEPLEPEE